MLIEIIAKYDSWCVETGRCIPKGARALFNVKTRAIFNWESQRYRMYRELLPKKKLKDDGEL
jgi:hypothetical protein